MATPSSSATSPSPPMAYLSHTQLPLQLPISSSSDVVEREHRKIAVEKFLARAEISMVTRALRARLSYASYKATHNIPHVNIRDLEAQSQQSQAASFNRTIAAKRKAGVSNYYNNPATQGTSGNGTGTGIQRRGGSGSMAPPASISSPRTHYPSANSTGATNNNETASSSRNAYHSPSLYASILAPPSTKQARTIHNANDPPVPAPSRPTPSPRARVSKQSPRTDTTRPHGKGRQVDKAMKAASSPDKRKAKRASIDKGKQKQLQSNMDADGDVDMKAAATLTSLLLHHRPSIAGSASSPRSSLDGSDAGSTYSYSHFAQSSARTTTVSTFSPPVSTITSSSMDVDSRNQTPPPPFSVNTTSTPRPAPTDNEAADLMLFLATSPSPARVPNQDPKDLAAYRALGGAPGPLRSKGRVLFPSIGSGELPRHDDPSGAIASRGPSTLARGGESSFSSSISSIGTEMGVRTVDASSQSSITRTPSQLLSPPPLPAPLTIPQGEGNQSPRPSHPPGSMDFNFHDFINASPSPSRGTATQNHKSNLGLRADVGRKLFEEEQMRHALLPSQSPGKQQNERSLGAGIDLVPS